MREWIDIRVDSEEIVRRLSPELGKDLDRPEEQVFDRELDPDYVSGRQIFLPRDDPRWQDFLAALEGVSPEEREGGWWGWFVRRYSKKELSEAEILRLDTTKVFEPEGESCGTLYDDSQACPKCGAGRRQVSDLHLQLRRVYQGWPSIPQAKHTGIARTIADEVIVSQFTAELMKAEGITGGELGPVRGCGRNAKVTPLWRQLWVIGKVGRTVAPTEFGAGPFKPDEEGAHRCPYGHVSGLNLLSEVYVERKNWDGSGICATEDLAGVRRGVLVPAPMILISQRFYRLLREHNVKGFKAEVAHLVQADVRRESE